MQEELQIWTPSFVAQNQPESMIFSLFFQHCHHSIKKANSINKSKAKSNLAIDDEKISIWNIKIRDQGVKLMISCSSLYLENIRHLVLFKSRLTELSMRRLVRVNWKCLENLNLGNNWIGDKGLKVLCNHLKVGAHFKELQLQECGVCDIGVLYVLKLEVGEGTADRIEIRLQKNELSKISRTLVKEADRTKLMFM